MTEDKLFEGDLWIFQPEQGYRFSVDSVLLAHYTSPRSGERILDLGAGCGIISLILAYRRPMVGITALELQDSLYRLLKHNVEINGYTDRINTIQGDLKEIRKTVPAESFDLVFSNPPYRPVLSGRQSPAEDVAAARHELRAELTDTVEAAAYAVRNRGRVAFVYPADRLAKLMEAMREKLLEPKRIQTIHPYPGAPARMVLLEAVKYGGEGVSILSPFFIYQKKGGDYTPEMAAMYERE